MKKLTPTVKRKITEDWSRCFPEMGIYKPLHLLRRVDALLIGILLERDSTNDRYLPTFHVHNLAKHFPVVKLTLSEPLRTETTCAPDKIKVSQHESKFRQASERISQQASLPLKGDIRLSDVICAYKEYFHRPTTHYEIELFEDLIWIATSCFDLERASLLLSEAREILSAWPRNILDSIGGLDEWYRSYKTLIENPRQIKNSVEAEIKRFGLERIPVSRMIVEPKAYTPHV
jgi:hypothetical protein